MIRGDKEQPISNYGRITKLEEQVQTLSSLISQLVKELKTTNFSRASSSKRKIDNEDEDNDKIPKTGDIKNDMDKKKNHMSTLKNDFKVEISIYSGVVNAKKLDNWICTLKTYFFAYKYSNGKNKFNLQA